VVLLAATIVAFVTGLTGPPAGAVGPSAAPSDLSLFDARAVGSVVGFSFHVPEAVFPFQIVGGMLESTSLATSTPQAFGLAGLAPVPLASSVGLVIPRVIPGTQIPVPDDVQNAFKSIDFTALPNSCQANFPPLKDGGDQATCGGPYQSDGALGFTAAGLNGIVKATGDLDEPFATRMSSISRGGDITVPGLQAKLHQAYSESGTGINDAGLPQGRAVAEMDSLSLLGNLVHLEGIRSETIVATNGTPEGAVARSTLTVRGAAVFGVPVVIGPDGVTVNKEQVPGTEVRTAAAKVEAALAQNGNLRIRLVPAPPVETRGGEVTAQSGAIEIAYVARTPTPVDVVQRFAYTQARVNAVPGGNDAGSAEGPSSGLPLPSTGSPLGSGPPSVPAVSTTGPSDSAPVGLSAETSVPTIDLSALPTAAPTGADGGGALGAPVLSGEPTPPQPGLAASTGRVLGNRKVLSLTSALGPATRVRINALYGGTVGLSVLGFALIPLRRRLMPTRPPQATA
jgi:hypothetical protein